MKYKLHIEYFDYSAIEAEADKYYIQSGVLILEKKENYGGQVLRTDERYIVFRAINLKDVKEFEVRETEERTNESL